MHASTRSAEGNCLPIARARGRLPVLVQRLPAGAEDQARPPWEPSGGCRLWPPARHSDASRALRRARPLLAHTGAWIALAAPGQQSTHPGSGLAYTPAPWQLSLLTQRWNLRLSIEGLPAQQRIVVGEATNLSEMGARGNDGHAAHASDLGRGALVWG
jgi:hypothetical protein